MPDAPLPTGIAAGQRLEEVADPLVFQIGGKPVEVGDYSSRAFLISAGVTIFASNAASRSRPSGSALGR